MDHEALARDVLRALRGRRSQPAFSRRLGYKSNVAYRWEAGRAWPTAAATFRAARRVGVPFEAALREFFRSPPSWLEQHDLASKEGTARLMEELRGTTPIVQLAARSGRSRFAIMRWLKAEAEPRLPEFLGLVEAMTLRVLDFVRVLVDPAKLPSVADAWNELELARQSAYHHPWAHGVLRVLELSAYQRLPRHTPGWIATELGISLDEEERCLELLAATRQIRRRAGKWQVDEDRMVDTRGDAVRSREVKDWWTRVALERIQKGAEHTSSYNLFSISERDYQSLIELYRDFFERMRGLIARSAPNERVVLFTTQIVGLSEGSTQPTPPADTAQPSTRTKR